MTKKYFQVFLIFLLITFEGTFISFFNIVMCSIPAYSNTVEFRAADEVV
jgi:hypothetical protein